MPFCPFSFCHCVVCPSIYGLWLYLWYLFLLSIVLSVLRFTDSDYTFGIFVCCPLCCLSFDWRILSIPLVSSNSFLFNNQCIWYIQSSLSMWSPLLTSHLYYNVAVFLSFHRKFHMNLTSFKKSSVLKATFFCPKGDLLIQVWLYRYIKGNFAKRTYFHAPFSILYIQVWLYREECSYYLWWTWITYLWLLVKHNYYLYIYICEWKE